MWKAGIAIFTLFNNVFARITVLLLEKKNCVRLKPGILPLLSGNAWRRAGLFAPSFLFTAVLALSAGS